MPSDFVVRVIRELKSNSCVFEGGVVDCFVEDVIMAINSAMSKGLDGRACRRELPDTCFCCKIPSGEVCDGENPICDNCHDAGCVVGEVDVAEAGGEN